MEKSIQIGLDDLEAITREFPKWQRDGVRDVKCSLGVMRLMFQCRKIWCEDARSEFSLCTMEETVVKTSLEIQLLYLTLKEASNDHVIFEPGGNRFYEFLDEIVESIGQGMKEAFDIVSDVVRKTSSSSHLETEDLLNIIDAILHILPEFLGGSYDDDIAVTVRSLKNFILFAALQGLEHPQTRPLLVHVQASVFHLAHSIFELELLDHDDHLFGSIDSIDPFKSPGTCDIYLGVLQEALELRQSSIHLIPESNALESSLAFVGSLRSFLFRIIFRGEFHWYTFDHQIRKLYEGLEFIKTALREHQDKVGEYYEKMNDLIPPLICEAGLIIFYLIRGYEVEEGMVKMPEAFLSDFEEKLELVKGAKEAASRYSLTSASYFRHTNLLGFIDSFLKKIHSFNFNGPDSVIASEKNQVQAVYDDLEFLRSFLVSALLEPDQNKKLKTLWNRIATVAYEAEFVLDSLIKGDDLQNSVVMLNTIIEEIELIKIQAMGNSHKKRKIIQEQNITETKSNMQSLGKLPEVNEIVVGLDDETQNIIDRLTRGTKKLDIVSIVGMAGLGKTTLAKRVYLHISIIYHFQIRSWGTVSQVYNKKNLLLEILRGVDVESTGKHSEMNEDDLARRLYQCLKRKRYLIILDDIWDAEAWGNLRFSFPDDGYGSRILLTSRDENVASQIEPHSQPPHSLRFLTSDESVELFRKKMPFIEDSPSEVLERGKTIVQRYKGLPLMIIVIAGILSNIEPSTWGEVEETLNKGIDQVNDTIELSYNHLPDHLKPCFLYFGAYEEDQQIPVREMLWLWIAEGFVMNTGRDCIEDVAESYMMELIQRSLVMVGGKEPGGKMEFCILHDVLREFCLRKSNKEDFLLRLQGVELGSSIDPSMLHRSLVYTNRVEDFVEVRLFCPRLRTLFLVADYKEMFAFVEPWYGILYKFCESKFLGVLDLRGIYEFEFFPCVILLLVELRYLAMYTRRDTEIPSSIERLWKLETFVVVGYDKLIFLRDTLWNMKRLRHLYSSRNLWRLPRESPRHLPNLENLQILSRAAFADFQELNEVIGKCPSIRILKCVVDNPPTPGGTSRIIALDCLNQLESLSLSSNFFSEDLDYQFQFPLNLKELTLSKFRLPWSKISTIHRLKNLEVLKLVDDAFIEENWDMKEEEEIFPNLIFLKLKRLDLGRWTGGSDETFPRLEKLVLQACDDLVELPSCLAQIPKLEMIEVISCSGVVDSIKQIHEMLVNEGKEEVIKILIKPSQWDDESKTFDELDHALSEDNTTQSSNEMDYDYAFPDEGTDE
ncbi:OLC1v1038177C1 [Oldenlandia corymbosa var. corymbosa]|uniref:OLC1v1038177C1 n=1 Tax=Oldenlandia corymbosa var. corymbosa TaxID=529605 RepID=A0AAV1D2Z2_OLDCO|nr:OLC1v1038177C1 [Oldenlandia corymbosa var. corymbosa]